MEVAVRTARNEDVSEDYVEPTIPEDRMGWCEDSTFFIWDARIAAADKAIEVGVAGRTRAKGSLLLRNSVRMLRLKEISDRGVPVKFCKREDLVTATDAITVTTFHQLKGLEFDHVVITGLEGETMPQFWINKQHSEKPEELTVYASLGLRRDDEGEEKSCFGGGDQQSVLSGIPDDLFQRPRCGALGSCKLISGLVRLARLVGKY